MTSSLPHDHLVDELMPAATALTGSGLSLFDLRALLDWRRAEHAMKECGEQSLIVARKLNIDRSTIWRMMASAQDLRPTPEVKAAVDQVVVILWKQNATRVDGKTRFETAMVHATFHACGRNYAEVARRLGMHRNNVWKILERDAAKATTKKCPGCGSTDRNVRNRIVMDPVNTHQCKHPWHSQEAA